MGNEEIKYFKVLGEGLKTRNGFQWIPGRWNIEPKAKKSVDVCGVGLHVWKNKPRWDIFPYMIDHTYRVEAVEDLCGEDDEKARFRRVKLARLPMTLDEILGRERKGLRDANLYRAELSHSNLSSADLSWTTLNRANLSGANLSGANLYHVNLSWANLSDANLSWVNLKGADLFGTNLSWANLTGVDLTKVYLSRAILQGATFYDAHGCRGKKELTDEQKKQAHC